MKPFVIQVYVTLFPSNMTAVTESLTCGSSRNCQISTEVTLYWYVLDLSFKIRLGPALISHLPFVTKSWLCFMFLTCVFKSGMVRPLFPMTYLCNWIIDIHSRHTQFARLRQLIKTMDSCHRFLHDALDQLEGFRTLFQHQMGGVSTVIQNLNGHRVNEW